MKKTIKLKESELRNMISESLRRVLKEGKYLPDGYDDEWEENVDDESNKYVDFDRPSMFGFPTLRNPYKDAQRRLSGLNDTDSVGQPNNTIFGVDSTPYGNEYWMYDREGNKTNKGYNSIYDKDNIRYDSDEWDYDNDQPMWKTHMNNKNYEVPTSPFATDERSLSKKSYMASGGGYEQDLAKQKRNADKSTKRAMDAADKRPLHRKDSLNRAMDESINRIVSKLLRKMK